MEASPVPAGPRNDIDLQLRLIIIAHTGTAGYRGCVTTTKTLSSNFSWSSLSLDVANLVRSCINCLLTTPDETVPRFFGPPRHGRTPSALLQFDYRETSNSPTGGKYILMLRNNHSEYIWLYPAETMSAGTAASSLIDRCVAFGIPEERILYGPSHLKNETLHLLTKSLQTPHNFTLSYPPWSNGETERQVKELLCVTRSLFYEMQQRFESWPQHLPII